VNNFEKTLLLVENSNSLKATMQSGKQSYPILSLSKPKSLNPNHVLKHNAKIQWGSVLHSSIRADSHSHVLQCLWSSFCLTLTSSFSTINICSNVFIILSYIWQTTKPPPPPETLSKSKIN
jgi:hypothetical protein